MTQARRHDAILQLLGEQEELSADELASRFGVNVVTVRRDLAALESRGLVRRTHGGAISARSGRVEFEFHRRQQTRLAEKSAIAEAVAALVQPGMAVSLDTGTTTLCVARRLRAIAPPAGIKVLTNSLAIAAELYPCENVELVLLGGSVRKGSPDMAGPLTEDNLRRFRVNLAILGADAVSPDGLFTTDAATAGVSAAMIAGADAAVVAADSSKFHATAFVKFAAWADIDAVATDAGVPPECRAWLDAAVAKVTYASVSST